MSREIDIAVDDHWFIGADQVFEFTVDDGVDPAGTNPVNIAAYALEWVLREDRDSTAAILTKATGGSGIVITDGANGKCQVTIDAADTLGLTPGIYFHTLRRTGTGTAVPLAFGKAYLRYAATR